MPTDPRTPHTMGPLALTIGVTGHRDLRPEDEPALRKAVADCLAGLRRRMPHTPFLVLSPLAEGADCLVAEVAVEQPDSRLIGVLPLGSELYRRDFTAEGWQRHARLAQRAQRVMVVPAQREEAAAAIAEDGESRDRMYLAAGHFVALHSHILIALWDGTLTHKVGGTAEIVAAKLAGRVLPGSDGLLSLRRAEAGSVYHFLAPRRSKPAPAGAVGALSIRHADPWIDQHADPAATEAGVIAHIERFNADAVALARRGAAVAGRGGAAKTAELLATADELAGRFGRLTRRYALALFAAGVMAVTALQLHEHVADGGDWLSRGVLGLYVALAVAGLVVPKIAAWLAWQERFQDYRALAEGARVQLHWRLAGLRDGAADHYLNGQADELDWIRRAIRTAYLEDESEKIASGRPAAPTPIETLHRAASAWIDDQLRYFLGTSGDERSAAIVRSFMKRVRALKYAKLCAAAALVFGAGRFLSSLFEFDLDHRIEDLLRHWGAPISAVLLAAAAAFAAYVNVMAYSEQYRRYVSMARTYRLAKANVEALLSRGEAGVAGVEAVLRELGKEALAENGDWLITHRQRPIKKSPL